MVQKNVLNNIHPLTILTVEGLLTLLRHLPKFIQGISGLETLFNSDFELIKHRFQIKVMALQQRH